MTHTKDAKAFAEYLVSIDKDTEFGIQHMATLVGTDEGRETLGEVADILSHEHGVSSKIMKAFRSSLRKACVMSSTPIYSPKKRRVKGTKDYVMGVELSSARVVGHPNSVPTRTPYVMAAMAVIQYEVAQGRFTLSDARGAVDILTTEAKRVHP